MKRAFVLGLALMLAGPALADPLEGVWQTASDDDGNYGHIEVSACGEAFCGVLIRSFDSSGTEFNSENAGRQIIWEMKAQGDGKYGGGKVWSPDRDQTYASKMVLDGDVVTVKGCVLVICRDGGTWTRVQ